MENPLTGNALPYLQVPVRNRCKPFLNTLTSDGNINGLKFSHRIRKEQAMDVTIKKLDILPKLSLPWFHHPKYQDHTMVLECYVKEIRVT